MSDAAMSGTFSQVLLFQVRPDRVEAFEVLVRQVQREQEQLPGCLQARYMKRFYTFDGVEWGQPPRELTKIVKCVKYYAYLEFGSAEDCGAATGWLFENHAKELTRMCIAPFDISSGYTL